MILWKVSLFIFLFSATFAEEEKQEVLELTDETFRATVEEHDVTLVMFYAPWCGHCKSLKPEFEEAAKTLHANNPPVTLARMDCTEAGKSTCDTLKVEGYPTLKIYRSVEKNPTEYTGPREYDGIVKYMLKQIEPSSKEITTNEELEKLLASQQFVVIGYFDGYSELQRAFWNFADKRDENIVFAHCFNKEMLKKLKLDDDVALYRPSYLKNKFEESSLVYRGWPEGMETYMKRNYHGLVAVRTQSNAESLDLPLVTVYLDIDFEKNPKGTGYWRNRILKVAKNFDDQGNEVYFAMSDKSEFEEEIRKYGLSAITTDKPLCAALNAKKQKFVMRKGFSVEALEEFVDNFLQGKLEPYIRSEEVPSDNTGPVKIAVGKTFNEIVVENGKDAMVEFYAPWCGHCKKLKPTYEKLGKKMQKEDVDIVMFDATENDYPPDYEITGFPTLFWVPKDKKDKPIKYNGGLKIDDLIKYIAQNSAEELKSYDRNGKPKAAKKSEL